MFSCEIKQFFLYPYLQLHQKFNKLKWCWSLRSMFKVLLCWHSYHYYVHSFTSVEISHLQKAMLAYLNKRHGLLLKGHRLYENLISDKIKRESFQVIVVSELFCGCTTWTQKRRLEKILMGITLEFYMLFSTDPASSIRQNSSCKATYIPSHKLSKWNE